MPPGHMYVHVYAYFISKSANFYNYIVLHNCISYVVTLTLSTWNTNQYFFTHRTEWEIYIHHVLMPWYIYIALVDPKQLRSQSFIMWQLLQICPWHQMTDMPCTSWRTSAWVERQNGRMCEILTKRSNSKYIWLQDDYFLNLLEDGGRIYNATEYIVHNYSNSAHREYY